MRHHITGAAFSLAIIRFDSPPGKPPGRSELDHLAGMIPAGLASLQR